MKAGTIAIWILRLLAAIIMLQTLYFKFTAHPESVQIFSTLGMEPWGRIGTGVLELIASILILVPSTTGIGALLGVGLMSGAIFFHSTRLGIKINGDATLFFYCITNFVCCLALLVIYRSQIFLLIKRKKI